MAKAKRRRPVRAESPRREAPRPTAESIGARGARQVWEWVKSLGVAILLFLVIRTFLVQSFYITSGSMIPTLLIGDFLLVSRAAYGAQIPLTDARLPGYADLERGDIVVFDGPHQPELDLVKRLIGLPGDTLEMRGGTLYLDGEPLEEPYVQRTRPGANETHEWMRWQLQFLSPTVDAAGYRPRLNDWGPIIVPPDSYFMLGDNRDESLDSRFWGFVPRHMIEGEALFLYYSYDPTRLKPFPWITAIRWDRFGDWIR